MNKEKSLGERLKELRIENGFSQHELAEKLHISRQAISKWETNKAYPDIDNLIELAKCYKVTIDDILKENDDLQVKVMKEEKNVTTNDEGIILLVAAIGCSLIFPLGLIIIPFIFIRNRKNNTFYRLIYVVCIISFLINLYEGVGHIGNYLHHGETIVEKIK